MIPSVFCDSGTKGVAEFAASMRGFNPAGFRAMVRASTEADLRDVLGRIDLATLLLYGDRDVQAPLAVAIPRSRLVVLPGVGHVSRVEAPQQFNREVRDFLGSTKGDACSALTSCAQRGRPC
jgi:pimeloyl-ACP methyl ester carboxylesterase